ncbi:MAG TPA: hypothetical protein VFT20_01140 [Candidatus Limnocylindrales bacterium]|nr:hypothetical protein [Candidatus Limnocylindrales bacterium]
MTRSDEPLFDPRIANWLEEDPYGAPDRALDVVLAAFPSIKQRRAWRVPWRVPNMNGLFRLGLAAAAVVVALAGGLYLLAPPPGPAAPGPTPTGTPAASPTPTIAPTPTARVTPAGPKMSTFTSTVHGYTIDHPVAYAPLPATQAWPEGGFVGNEEPWIDRFVAPSTGAVSFVGIASQDLPAGMLPEAWLDGYVADVATRGCPVPAGNWTETTVGDAPGRRAAFECDGLEALEVAWVAGGRGFVATGQAAVIDLMLATIRYE